MARPLCLFGIACFALASAGAARARDEVRPSAMAITDAIESCVDASTIRFRADDPHALLDTADAEAVRAAIVRRYPKVEDDGLAPERIVLWKHPDFGWVYVALLVNPAKPGEVCFTASFGADKFETSPALIAKYFGKTM
ncbi:MAG: hypothetical protein ABI330_05315 [Caldimonas sp.]|nr:hypothetical protein [Pseudomonadota bacterium]